MGTSAYEEKGTAIEGDPDRPMRIAKVLASHLTRRYRRILYVIMGLLIIAGLIHGYLATSSTAFPRYGAIIALATFWHASVQQRYLAMLQHDAEPIARELGGELGRDPAKTSAHLERLRTSVQRSFNTDYLICGTIGVLVWGFGDLLFVR